MAGCNLVLGLTVTQEWYDAGFEKLAGDDRWEAILQPHTFVEHWADPNYEAWTKAPTSPCAQNAASPDRVLLFAANWTFTTADEWTQKLDAAVDAIKTKFASVRQIVLLPMVRAPGNATCGDPKSVVLPHVDEAMDKVAERRPELVIAGPHFEVKSCDLFKKGGPHFTEQGGAEVAKVIAEHFAKAPSK